MVSERINVKILVCHARQASRKSIHQIKSWIIQNTISMLRIYLNSVGKYMTIGLGAVKIDRKFKFKPLHINQGLSIKNYIWNKYEGS